MLPAGPAIFARRQAADLVDATRTGREEWVGLLDGSPLLLVDLDADSDPNPHPQADPTTPADPVLTSIPCLIAGFSRDGAAPWRPCDVLLTAQADAPRPWVTVPDLPAALEHLSRRVHATPVASVMVAQLLRVSERGSIDEGLFRESLAYSTLQAGAEFKAWLGRRPPPRTRAPAGLPVTIERRDDELTITLHRPEVRNAYNAATRDHLVSALQLAATDPSIARIVLDGSGSAFSSGGDLDEFGTATDPAVAHVVRTTRSAARALAGVAGRVTAYLHGACVGAGIELPAYAATVVADPDTRIRLPETGMGLVPGAGGTVSIPRRVGRHRAAWLAVSDVELDAVTALAWGLVDRIEASPPRTGDGVAPR